jgi:hypothetical protein
LDFGFWYIDIPKLKYRIDTDINISHRLRLNDQLWCSSRAKDFSDLDDVMQAVKWNTDLGWSTTQNVRLLRLKIWIHNLMWDIHYFSSCIVDFISCYSALSPLWLLLLLRRQSEKIIFSLCFDHQSKNLLLHFAPTTGPLVYAWLYSYQHSAWPTGSPSAFDEAPLGLHPSLYSLLFCLNPH